VVTQVKTWCRAEARHHVDEKWRKNEKFLASVILPKAEAVRNHYKDRWLEIKASLAIKSELPLGRVASTGGNTD
jgi:hypothetical protein